MIRSHPLNLSGAAALLLLATPALTHNVFAHNVEVTADIAGTWHLEPNHSPKAGEPASVWIALTRRGGTILPLEQATCQLDVYTMPRQPTDAPILQPQLRAISVEQYQGIPAAELVFPQTGLYELELGCTPVAAGDFQPFQMSEQVTVTAGAAAPATSSASPTPQPAALPAAQPKSQVPIGLLIVSAIGVLVALLLRRGK